MKVHNRVLALVLSLVMLLALAACGGESGGEETGGPETGEVKDTITVAVNAEPSVLDPPNQQSGTAGMVNVQIYEGLRPPGHRARGDSPLPGRELGAD